MPEPDDPPGEPEPRVEEIRAMVVRLARKKSARRIDDPNRWHPQEVMNPIFGGVLFTPVAAWEFIADCFEEGLPFESKEQDKPPKSVAHQMVVDIDGSDQQLFIKVRISKSGAVIYGRSFHYSTDPRVRAENERAID